jgi:hypothetical protein
LGQNVFKSVFKSIGRGSVRKFCQHTSHEAAALLVDEALREREVSELGGGARLRQRGDEPSVHPHVSRLKRTQQQRAQSAQRPTVS